ncbi:hypothetical protein BKA70DRAFT_119754 [Coprinopsis sp. MPI-PUGE-AT-0042]|nr:hypothetical protein BKA70DRAFT_119754 [Coprinopsis sp. MPI-PUGE-AT-0042]
MNPTSPAPQSRDEEFFWDSATFLVEGVLFRVPKDRLIHGSENFSRQYALREQQASSCPIQLDITQEDFRTFLRALHPRYAHADLIHEGIAESNSFQEPFLVAQT